MAPDIRSAPVTTPSRTLQQARPDLHLDAAGNSDTNNNYVRYIYTKDSGQIYPSQILYTGNGGTDGIFSIDFTKSSRSDTYTNYLPASLLRPITASRRLLRRSTARLCASTTSRTRRATMACGHFFRRCKRMDGMPITLTK